MQKLKYHKLRYGLKQRRERRRYHHPSPYISGQLATLVRSGAPFLNLLLHEIEHAKNVIHFQTYIFNLDKSGQRVCDALEAALARGVKIYLLMDAFGSFSYGRIIQNKLSAKGAQVCLFNAFFARRNFHIGRRLHHKVMVFDGRSALVGGLNIGDEYLHEENPWLDFAVLIEGREVLKINNICEKMFRHSSDERVTFFPVARNSETMMQFTQGYRLRVLQNDYMSGRHEIHYAIIDGIKHARYRITIMCSYFFPFKELLKALLDAAGRGVVVTLILGHHSDVAVLNWGRNYLYPLFWKHGILIYEWEKSVLHAKVVSIDGMWCQIGSYNLNFIGRYSDIEMNVAFYDQEFAGILDQTLLALIDGGGCRGRTPQQEEGPLHVLVQLRNWCCYWMVKIIMTVSLYCLPREKYKVV